MDDEKKSIVFYRDWWEALRSLPPDKRLEALDAILVYGFENETPTEPMIAAITALMRSTIDRDSAKWIRTRENRRANIQKRWEEERKRKQAQSSPPDEDNEADGAVDSEDLFLNELKNDTKWFSSMARKLNSSTDEIAAKLDEFINDNQCRGKTHLDIKDLKNHFIDWISIQIQRKDYQKQHPKRKAQNDENKFQEHILAKLSSQRVDADIGSTDSEIWE